MAASPTTEVIEATQERMLEAVRQGQDAMVNAVSMWSQAVAKAMPELPKAPYADQLPTPAELVETSFSFAEKLLNAQHQFAKDVLAASAPLLSKTTRSNGSSTPRKSS